MLAEAQKQMVEFAEKGNIPVASTLLGLSAFPAQHPLYVGYLGMHGNYGPNVLTNDCDVLIAVGMRFDDRVTGNVNTYAKQAKVVHIEIDRAEINKIVKADVPVLGDAKGVLNMLTPLIKKDAHSKERKEWISTI